MFVQSTVHSDTLTRTTT